MLWDLKTYRALCTFEGHSRVPIALGFSADGKTLHSCGHTVSEIELFRWSLADGRKIDQRKLDISISLTFELPVFSRDGRMLAAMTSSFGHSSVCGRWPPGRW